jgi:predicted HTH transcriptional regulator
MSVSAADVKALLSHGEDESTEFKGAVPHPENIARHIGAFANASGGRLILGVTEVPGKEPAIHGVDAGRARRAIERAFSALEPMPDVDIETVRIDGSDVVVVDVKPSMIAPVLAQGVSPIPDLARPSEPRPLTSWWSGSVQATAPKTCARCLSSSVKQSSGRAS